MVDVSSLRSKIENKVFLNLGSACTVSSITTSSVDKWGDKTEVTPSGVSATFVPWNIFNTRESYQPFGDLQEGDMDCAFRYNQDLVPGYRVVFDSTNYRILFVEEFYLKDSVLVKVARLRKEL